jgi:hypothetical protein
MASPYDKILTGVGLMNKDDVTLTKSARDKFIDEVSALLLTGNDNGKGQLNALGQLLPIPPIAGPMITNVTTLQAEPLFWFKPDPFALLMIETIKDPKKVPFYHKIFLDILFEKTAAAMNVAGGTPLAASFILDWSFGFDIPFPPALPDLAFAFDIPLPDISVKLPALMLDLGINFALPTFPIPPIPPDISLELPIPPLILIEFCIGLIKIPFDLVLQLAIPSLDLALNLPDLPKIVFELAFKLMFDLMIKLNLLLITPKLLVASLLVYLKNIVGMVCTDLIGLIFGASGQLTKTAAGLCGLV